MKNYIQPGHVVSVITPEGGMTSSVGYIVNKLFGVANLTTLEDEKNELSVDGVYEFTGTGDFGDIAYFNDTTKAVTETAANGLYPIGLVVGAGYTAGKVQVRLNGTDTAALSGIGA